MKKDPQYVVYVADEPKVVHFATKIKFIGVMKCIYLATQTGKQCNLRALGEKSHCFEAMPPPDFPRLA
jgi:hypothetical protein